MSENRLNRRDFLLLGSTTLAAAGCTGQSGKLEKAASPAEAKKFELEEITVAELASSIRAGERTCKSVTELYLGRIAEVDRQKGLNAVIEVNPDAVCYRRTA